MLEISLELFGGRGGGSGGGGGAGYVKGSSDGALVKAKSRLSRELFVRQEAGAAAITKRKSLKQRLTGKET